MLIILNECISFELTIGQKVCKVLSLYRSPSQNRDEFETFLEFRIEFWSYGWQKSLFDGCPWLF